MKTLIFCFDGTANDERDADPKRTLFGFGKVKDCSISNILKLHLLLGGTLTGKQTIPGQHSFYYSGVGTYGGFIERFINFAFAPPHLDVGRIIKQAVKDFSRHYDEDADDKLVVFGYSRGGAIARRFCAVLKDTYVALGIKKEPVVEFLGVMETVAVIMKPNFFNKNKKPTSDVVFENGTVSSIVKQALHILALDDRRILFFPTLMNREPNKVTEVWFPGTHANIGGGRRYDGLSDNTLQFIIDFIDQKSSTTLSWLAPFELDYDSLFSDAKKHIKREDVEIHANPCGHAKIKSCASKMNELRTPRVNVNDKHSVYAPTIHCSVFKRLARLPDYTVENLNPIPTNHYTGVSAHFSVMTDSFDMLEDFANATEALNALNTKCQHLEKGCSINVSVHANLKYNESGILVGYTANEQYLISVDLNQIWFDGSIKCSARGWSPETINASWIKERLLHFSSEKLRVASKNHFELCACIDKNDHYAQPVVNETGRYILTIPDGAQGELYFFANDIEKKYGNNRGSIHIMVMRL